MSAPAPTTHPDTFGIPPEVYHRRWIILGVLNLSLVTVVLAVSSLNVALPTLARDLKATGTQLQWIVDSYALVFAGLLLLAGAISDRFGRKGALQTGLVIFGLGSLAASQSSSAQQLILWRSVLGIGAALIMPSTLSIIINSFPLHERGKAIAIWAAFAGIGGAIGPISSGFLLEHFWWGSVFFANVIAVVILLGLTIPFVPTSRDDAGHPLDIVGAALSVVGLVSLVFAVIEGPDYGWFSPKVLGSFALAAATLTAFVYWELRASTPMLDPRLFKLRGFSTGSMSVTMAFFAQFGMFFLLTQYLQFVKGYTPLQAGVRQLPIAIALLIVSPNSPRIVAKLGVRNSVSLGFAIAACGFFALSLLTPTTPYPQIMLSLIPLGVGIALVMPPSSQLIVGSVPLSKAGVGSAVNDVTREVGGALGIAVLGSIVTSLYRHNISPVLAKVPPQADKIKPLVKASIGQAYGVASKLPPEIGGKIRAGVAAPWVDAASVAFVVAAAMAFLAAVLTFSLMPKQLPTRVVGPPAAGGDAAPGGTAPAPAV